MRHWIAPLVLALVALPGMARAQGGCDVSYEHNWRIFGQGTPSQAQYWGGNVRVTCEGGRRQFQADSMIAFANGEQRLLIGHAYASDPEKTLSAAQINYMGAQSTMFAQTGVVLTDKVNGAVITAEFMNYTPAKDGRASRAVIYGNRSNGERPHAVLRRKPAPPAAGATPTPADTAPTLVDADRFEIEGQNTFHALGNVIMTRQDMRGVGQEALYDPDADHLRLLGNAKVTGESYTLSGGTIDGTLVGNQFKDVTATFKAVLEAKDLRVNAPALTVSFQDGQVQRMVALSAERSKRTATDGAALAEAFARDFHLLADSIEARAPAQKIEQVVAVGHAYGERQNDSIKVKMPEIASKDWLRGDTITGFFADARPAPPAASSRGDRNGRDQRNAAAPARADTAQRVLERVIAVGKDGSPASSMYRIPDDKKPSAVPAISYLLARTITLEFREGQVREVSAVGEIRGIHLQPEEPETKGKGKQPAPARRDVAASPAGTATATGSSRP